MATEEQIYKAETLAAHKAMKAYLETLNEELEKLQQTTIMEALGTSGHDHYALLYGERPGIIKFTVLYDESPVAIATALRAAQMRGDFSADHGIKFDR
jgi:hypothetical protein